MTFAEAVKSVYKNYLNFNGRAARSEYWNFFLFSIVTSIVIMVVEVTLGMGHGSFMHGGGGFSVAMSGGPLSTIWSLVNIIPGIAVGVRRLHDLDKSGWWLLIAFIPLIGAIILIVWLATKGTTGPNRFGEDQLSGSPTV